MRPIHRSGILGIVFLLLVFALAACGQATPTVEVTATTDPVIQARFDEGLQHLAHANELVGTAAQLSQAGEVAKAQAEASAALAEFQQAIDVFEEVLELEPDNTAAMVNLGAAFYNVYDLETAISYYEKALQLEPDDAAIHSNLAAVYVQKGDFGKALAAYQTAVDLQPDLAQAYFGLGIVYMESGQKDEAIRAFERFLELDAGQDPMASSLAEQYLRSLKGQ